MKLDSKLSPVVDNGGKAYTFKPYVDDTHGYTFDVVFAPPIVADPEPNPEITEGANYDYVAINAIGLGTVSLALLETGAPFVMGRLYLDDDYFGEEPFGKQHSIAFYCLLGYNTREVVLSDVSTDPMMINRS